MASTPANRRSSGRNSTGGPERRWLRLSGPPPVSSEAAARLDAPRLAPQQGDVARREPKLPITAEQAHAKPDPPQLPRQRRASEQPQSMDFLFAAIQLPDLAEARDP